MPRRLLWTEAQDSQIRRLRTEGASWDTIAAVLGMARWTVIDRGRRIGALATASAMRASARGSGA
jgi:hypothetical protein